MAAMSFMTAVYVNGELRRGIRAIARRYAATWLPLDILAVVPQWLFLLIDSCACFEWCPIITTASWPLARKSGIS